MFKGYIIEVLINERRVKKGEIYRFANIQKATLDNIIKGTNIPNCLPKTDVRRSTQCHFLVRHRLDALQQGPNILTVQTGTSKPISGQSSLSDRTQRNLFLTPSDRFHLAYLSESRMQNYYKRFAPSTSPPSRSPARSAPSDASFPTQCASDPRTPASDRPSATSRCPRAACSPRRKESLHQNRPSKPLVFSWRSCAIRSL